MYTKSSFWSFSDLMISKAVNKIFTDNIFNAQQKQFLSFYVLQSLFALKKARTMKMLM